MSKRKPNVVMVITVKVDTFHPQRGHYSYQGSKTTFDNRPKRQRTRQGQTRQWKGEV